MKACYATLILGFLVHQRLAQCCDALYTRITDDEKGEAVRVVALVGLLSK